MLSFLPHDRSTSIQSCFYEETVEWRNKVSREHITGWQNRDCNHHPTGCSCPWALGKEAAGTTCGLWKLLGRLHPYNGSYFGLNHQRVLKKQIEKPTGAAEKLNFAVLLVKENIEAPFCSNRVDCIEVMCSRQH